jgi:hypothetical protein
MHATSVLAEKEHPHGLNGSVHTAKPPHPSKQRVTITLPVSLLERLRNAVYWTGHGTLARLIGDALEDAVAQLEQTNGGTFPIRLAPLKRGRPHLPTTYAPREGSL